MLPTISTSVVLAAEPDAPSPGRWRGVIELPGAKLDFGVSFGLGESGPTATMDIPMQGLKGGPLHDVVFSEQSMAFILKPPGAPEQSWARFELKKEEGGQSAKGVLKQAGMEFPVTMDRIPDGEAARFGPKRPQEPSPPFVYKSSDVTFRNEKSGNTLAGTLTIPPEKGPHPAVVLLSGSGPQDRDSTVFAHKPFLVLADHLTRRGIAVLRYDDRGVGGSTFPEGQKMGDSTTVDFADDAIAAVAFLKRHPDVDPMQIGLIGHSEGGAVAPIAASRSEDVRFIVLLAGTAVPGREIMAVQHMKIAEAEGVTGEALGKASEAHRAVMDLVARGALRDELRPAIRVLIEAQMGGGAQASEDQMNAMLDSQADFMTSKWFRTFATLDPREYLKQVKRPVLALNGGKDLQVIPSQNLPEIEKSLREAGNEDFTIKEMPGLNHLFQTAPTGSPNEYAQIEETFAPAALEEVSAWLLEKSGKTRRY